MNCKNLKKSQKYELSQNAKFSKNHQTRTPFLEIITLDLIDHSSYFFISNRAFKDRIGALIAIERGEGRD